MILDRLTLHNFKRFRDAEVDFKDGITGILGNNGTGKSSLVSAILFALYGVKATGIAAEYIVSGAAGPKEKCEVVLDFRIGGDAYKIIRTFRKGKTVSHEAEFYKNKSLLAKEVTPVEEAVRREIGMGPVDFRNTIYAAQKDLLALIETQPGKRKEWFQKALGIDYLKDGSDAILKAELDAKTAERERLAGQMEAAAARLAETDLHELEAAATAHRDTIRALEQQKITAQQEREQLAAKQKELAAQQLAYTALVGKQQAAVKERDADRLQEMNLVSQLALLATEQAEYDRLKPLVAGHDAVRQRLELLQKKRERFLAMSAELGFAGKQIADLKAREEAQRAKIAALDANRQKRDGLVATIRAGLCAGDGAEDRLETAYRLRLDDLSRQAGTLAARLDQYKTEREKIAADRETIARAGPDGTCPLCRQKLGAHFGSIEAEFSARIAELEENAVADLAKQERLENEKVALGPVRTALDTLRSLDAEQNQKSVYEQERSALADQRAKKEEEERRILGDRAALAFDEAAFRRAEQENRELQQHQIRFIELGKKIGQGIMAQQHLDALRERIGRREAELAGLADAIRAAAYDPAAADAAARALADADTRLREIAVRGANAQKDLEAADGKIAEYRRAGQQAAALQEQAVALDEAIALTKLTRNLIAEYVVYLMQVVRSRLESETSRILSEITGGRYEQVLLDADFTLLVRDIDSDYPVDRFSGGEQDDIAVALRIALSRYLAGLHDLHESTVLIFDEIFGSQDEERRAGLLTALRTQESRFPQILLISHIAEIQGEFANTLVVEAATEGGSRVRELSG